MCASLRRTTARRRGPAMAAACRQHGPSHSAPMRRICSSRPRPQSGRTRAPAGRPARTPAQRSSRHAPVAST
eukprot:2537687-Prymnesium_polylepis.3